MVTASQLAYIQENTSENLNFLGLSKAERAARAERKKIKAQAKADVKVERAKRNTDRAIELAKKGIDTSWAGFGKGLLSGASALLGGQGGGKVGGLLGGQTGGDPLYEGGYYPDEAAEPDNTGLYIGLGVGGLLIVGLIVWAVVKK